MDRKRKLEAELLGFPSYLNSRDECRTLTKRKLQHIVDRVKPEIESYDNDVQLLREFNLVAFLYHEMGNAAEAFTYIDKAISKNARCINGLVLKSWFHLKSGDVYESEKVLSELRAFKDIESDIIHAKAEVAYIYTRLGINFYEDAEDRFKSLLEEIKTNNALVDPSALCIWKFGLALIKRRALHFNNLTDGNKFDLTMEKVKQVHAIYTEILENDQVDKQLKARVLVELAELAYNAKLLNTDDIRLSRTRVFDRPAEHYYKDALKYSDSDPFVLNKCGKHYKYKDKTITESIRLLRKSLSIRETSFAHHHLALALKRKLEIDLRSSERKHDPGGRDCKSWDIDKHRKKAIKSPRKIKYLDVHDDASVREILDHFERAFEVGENASAKYDKGLFLRALRRNDEAIDVFRVFFREMPSTSLVLIANAYEQSAFCLMEKLEQLEEGSETKAKMTFNLKHYLYASIEMSYTRILPRCHGFQYIWSSKHILKEMLEKTDRTKETVSELHEFYSKIGNYDKDNETLRELLVKEEDEENRSKIYMDIVRNHHRLHNYDDAILTASLIGHQMEDRALFLNIYIEGGFQSYMSNENELAKLRLRTALDCRTDKRTPNEERCPDKPPPHEDSRPDKPPPNEEDDDNDTFEVFILSSETNENSPYCLKAALDKLGLCVTVNSDNLLIDEPKSSGMIGVMERSIHFVLFFEEQPIGDLLHYGETIRNICAQRGYGNRVVMKKHSDVQVPANFYDLPCLVYDEDVENVQKGIELTKPQIKSLKGLIQKLVGV